MTIDQLGSMLMQLQADLKEVKAAIISHPITDLDARVHYECEKCGEEVHDYDAIRVAGRWWCIGCLTNYALKYEEIAKGK